MLTSNQSDPPAANPLVTMIVLCYNQARFVVETLESVKAQTYRNTELIVIDDCSTDDSVAVIERWLTENEIRCTFIPHKTNQGICKSLNEALRLTTGKYISMIAGDDIWLPDKIERQVAIMESEPDSVAVVYSNCFRMDEKGNRLPDLYHEARHVPDMPQGRILDNLLQGNFIPGLTALIRRACYEKVGLYDETLPWEDWDMWMRMARHYSFIYSPPPAAQYRIHPSSITLSDTTRMLRDSLKICLKQFSVGVLTEIQKSILTATVLMFSEELYKRNDYECRAMMLATWKATGHKRAQWMYRFASVGVSFRNWQRIYALRARLLRSRYGLAET